MSALYPELEPYASGLLDVGDGNRLYWETCGSPHGKPAVVLHGGPGSGCSTRMRRFFDPAACRVVLFDQRNCGRSLPNAAEPSTDLSTNTTPHLVADVERLREELDVGRWLVFGGSWGSALALAYVQAHAERVGEAVLFGVTTGRHEEFDWVFRGGLSLLFPAEWERLQAAAGDGADVVEVFNRRLNDADPAVRREAADEWCRWESATPAWPPTHDLDDAFADPSYAVAFARTVVHYARHYGWLEDGALLRGAGALGGIPAVLVNGRVDYHAPIGWAWKLARAWPGAELVVVPEAAHSFAGALGAELVRATDRFPP